MPGVNFPVTDRAALTEPFEGSTSMRHRVEVAWRAAMNKNLKVRNVRAVPGPGSRVSGVQTVFWLAPDGFPRGFGHPVAFVVRHKMGLIGH